MDLSNLSRDTMLGKPFPVPGQAAQSHAAIDMTHVLDPAEFWPDPMSCPDWPMEYDDGYSKRRYEGPRGKAGAEMRMQMLGSALNRGITNLRKPTQEERAAEFARTFKRAGSPFYRYGINDLAARDRLTEDQARMMVDALHVRGYLRKLEAIEARQEEARKERPRAEARQTLARYRNTVDGSTEEIAALAEAAARHQQRIDDEKAFNRSRMLRQNLETLHANAVTAAHVLGEEAPARPAFS